MGKTRYLFKKIIDTKGIFHAKMSAIKDRNGMGLTEAEEIKKGVKNTQKNCTKKVLITWITRMLWSLTYSQTFWSVKSSGHQEASLKTKLVEMMEFQLSYFKSEDAVKVLHSICQQIWKTQQWPQDWKRSVFIPIPEKGNAKECSNYLTISLISHASKVMLKILQASLQQYMNREHPDIQADLEKAEESEIKLPTSIGASIKQGNSTKTSTSASLTTLKSLTVWITTNWKILKEMGIPDNLTCLLTNLYAGQEVTVRTEHETTDWFKTGKGVCQGYILSPCLFNLYAEYIMQNDRLDEVQAGIKIDRRNISNFRYADDTILMAESKEEPRAS